MCVLNRKLQALQIIRWYVAIFIEMWLWEWHGTRWPVTTLYVEDCNEFSLCVTIVEFLDTLAVSCTNINEQ